jgi:hypothetical protein
MTAFAGAVDATFAAFGIDAPLHAGGRRAGLGAGDRQAPRHDRRLCETRIHDETANFELRAIEVASPRPGDQLTVGGETFVIQGEPERRDLDRLVCSLDARPL